tara:strand:+ start:519 stop:815 length:297 start_codon:yes stop_codon:yes gene_type:complete
MITREEYNKALDIVEAYQKQLFSVSGSLIDNGKTLIENWDKLKKCSTRLTNILTPTEHTEWYKKNLPKYIEDVKKKGFYRLRNAGDVSWKQFTTLRGY